MASQSRFVVDFVNHILNEEEIDDNSIQRLRVIRRDLLKENELTTDVLDLKQITKILEVNFFDYLPLDREDRLEFVEGIFLEKFNLDTNILTQYLNQIKDKLATHSINQLYQFGNFEQFNLNAKVLENNLKKYFSGLKANVQFELLSNISLFLEHYKDTLDGKRMIGDFKSTNNEEKFFTELFDAMNSCSIRPIIEHEIGNKDKKSFAYASGGSGGFDGFFIINGISVSNNIQISATLDKGISIERNSLFRHSISSSLISFAIQEKLLSELREAKQYNPYDSNEELQSKLNEIWQRGYASNQSKGYAGLDTDLKSKFILEAIGEQVGKNFNSIESAVFYLNSNTHNVISNFVKTNIEITKDNLVDFYEEIKGKIYNANSKSFFVTKTSQFRNNEDFENSSLSNVIGDSKPFTMEEFRIGLQNLALISATIASKTCKVEPEAAHFFYSSILNNRGISKDKVDNEKISENFITKIEKIVVENYILKTSKDIEKNLNALGPLIYADNVDEYISFFLDKIDTKEKFNLKMKDLSIDTDKTYEEILFNIKETPNFARLIKKTASILLSNTQQEKKIENNAKIIEDSAKIIEDSAKIIEEKDKIIHETIIRLNKMNMAIEQIAAVTSFSEEDINKIINNSKKNINEIEYSYLPSKEKTVDKTKVYKSTNKPK